MNSENEINQSSQVELHLSLVLPDGTEALSTFEEEPVSFTMGDGVLREGMELALLGLKPTDEQTITLTPEQAYGYHDDSLIQSMPKTDFSESVVPQVGQIIGFSLPNGEETAGAVMAVSDSDVTIDFNHPLAGKDVIFKVKILSVSTPE